jgi:hypothetical protein
VSVGDILAGKVGGFIMVKICKLTVGSSEWTSAPGLMSKTGENLRAPQTGGQCLLVIFWQGGWMVLTWLKSVN